MAESEGPLIRVRVTNEIVTYLHNDLADAAWLFRERINTKSNPDGAPTGGFLDVIAAVTMLAFALEGYSNFLCERVLKPGGWDERDSVVKKIKAVARALNYTPDWNKHPYATSRRLIDLRHGLAHPRPIRLENTEWEEVGREPELRKALREYEPAIVLQLTPAFVNEAYLAVEAIWSELLSKAGIGLHETWSGGSQGLEYLGDAETDADSGLT